MNEFFAVYEEEIRLKTPYEVKQYLIKCGEWKPKSIPVVEELLKKYNLT